MKDAVSSDSSEEVDREEEAFLASQRAMKRQNSNSNPNSGKVTQQNSASNERGRVNN